MELRDREFFVYRIALGYTKYQVEDICLYIHEPILEELEQAQEVYLVSYQEAVVENVYTDQDILEIMRDKQLWSNKDEAVMKGLPKEMDDLKLAMFENNAARPSRVKKLREHLRKAEEQFKTVVAKRYSFETVTCEGYASYSRSLWKLENCTKMKDGSPCDWSRFNITDVLTHYHESKLEESQIRELSRTEPFRTLWHSSGKKSPFKRTGFDITSDQKSLIMWSGLYDNIADSPDCPSDDVIKDNDLLDGWLIKQRKEREQQKREKEAEKYDMDADEVFIPAHTNEDISNIQDLNDPTTKAIARSRHQQISEQESVDHANLRDVKRDLMMQANEQQINRSR